MQSVVACNATAPRVCTLVLFIYFAAHFGTAFIQGWHVFKGGIYFAQRLCVAFIGGRCLFERIWYFHGTKKWRPKWHTCSPHNTNFKLSHLVDYPVYYGFYCIACVVLLEVTNQLTVAYNTMQLFIGTNTRWIQDNDMLWGYDIRYLLEFILQPVWFSHAYTPTHIQT